MAKLSWLNEENVVNPVGSCGGGRKLSKSGEWGLSPASYPDPGVAEPGGKSVWSGPDEGSGRESGAVLRASG